MTGIMSEWKLCAIEDNLATRMVPISVLAWIESSEHGQEEKSLINVQLDHEKFKD